MNRIHFMPVIAIVAASGTNSTDRRAPTEKGARSLQPHNLGTLGGPHSYGSISGDGFRMLNNSGVVASFADIDEPDPNAPNFLF